MMCDGSTTRSSGTSFRCELLTDGAEVLAATGYMNAEAGRLIADRVHALFNRGRTRILVDLEDTRLVNHHGLLMLRALRDEIARRGGWLGFRNLSVTVARTFELAGLLDT